MPLQLFIKFAARPGRNLPGIRGLWNYSRCKNCKAKMSFGSLERGGELAVDCRLLIAQLDCQSPICIARLLPSDDIYLIWQKGKRVETSYSIFSTHPHRSLPASSVLIPPSRPSPGLPLPDLRDLPTLFPYPQLSENIDGMDRRCPEFQGKRNRGLNNWGPPNSLRHYNGSPQSDS